MKPPKRMNMHHWEYQYYFKRWICQRCDTIVSVYPLPKEGATGPWPSWAESADDCDQAIVAGVLTE